MQIGDVDTAKTLWESINMRHVGADRVKEARLQTLAAEFDWLTMSESECTKLISDIICMCWILGRVAHGGQIHAPYHYEYDKLVITVKEVYGIGCYITT